jgi:uncharacterized protein YndB with AHSA1/START domain
MKAAQARRLTVHREVAAPPAELFDAWLDPARLTPWMRPGDARRSTIKADARIGGEFEVVMQTPRGDSPHTGTYQVIERPRRLAFTWNSDAAGNRNSLVTIEFRPAGRGTEVVLTHENLPEDEVEGHTQGWSRVLDLMARSYSKAA